MSLPSRAELEQSIKGAFQLLLQKPEGMERFDVSVRGYWRSFYAMLYAAPLNVFLLISAPREPGAEDAGGGGSPGQAAAESFGLLDLAGEGLVYAIDWLYWPLLGYYMAEAFGRSERYVGYIVAYNWSRLLGLAILTAAAFLDLMIMGQAFGGFFLIATLLALFISWSVARHALDLPGMQAAGMVAIDILGGFAVYWGTRFIQTL